MKHILFLCALFVFSLGTQAQNDVNRPLTPFSKVRAFNKITLHISKGDTPKLQIKTKGNITTQDVVTEIKNNELKIRLRTKVYRDIQVDAYLTFSELQALSASAGAKIISKETLDIDNLRIDAGAGAKVTIPVASNFITAEASSGGEIILSGKTKNIKASAGSGAVVDAYRLMATEAYLKASTGGHIDAYTVKILEAKASTGGIINYKGSPKNKNTKTSLGGEINKRQ